MDGCRGVRGVLIKGRRVTWACVPREGRGEFLGEDRGFGCAGEGDESDSGARAVSGWRARAGADALGPGGRERARLRRAG